MNSYALTDYQYHIPDELIAQEAVHPHHNAKMMVIDGVSGTHLADTNFLDLKNILTSDDVIFFNNSRVVRSRIPLKHIEYTTSLGHRGIIEEGEIFFLKHLESGRFEGLVRPGSKMKVGTILTFREGITLEIEENTDAGRIILIRGTDIYSLMEEYGQLPLPPYIEYSSEKESDYQTRFAEKDGSVAAPTASLHFTDELLSGIQAQKEYITLHVGLGTFKGIDTDDVREYAIHREVIEVSKDIYSKIATYKQSHRNIIGVGTTVCRTLESLPYIWKDMKITERNSYGEDVQQYWNTIIDTLPESSIISNRNETDTSILCETQIYITPGYSFLIIDELITNFHLPGSSLLVLISAFLGYIPTMKIYQYAIENQYRFFSFGDGMYIRKRG